MRKPRTRNQGAFQNNTRNAPARVRLAGSYDVMKARPVCLEFFGAIISLS